MDGTTNFSLRDYPLLSHYGSIALRLSRKQAADADFETRFNSIGRYVVGAVIRFYHAKLSREGKINYDPQDLFLEVWIDLKARNAKYNESKGTYLTFARRIIQNRLSELLELTHCVKLPANASAKFKSLSGLSKDGVLSDAQQSRMDALVIANADHSELMRGEVIRSRDEVCPSEIAEDNERRTVMREALSDFIIKNLTVHESLAMSYAYGLWNRTKTRISDAERLHGFKPGKLIRALASAKRKMRDRLCCTLS